MKTRVRSGEICIGKPIPRNVYDDNGMLLLRKGFQVSKGSQLDILISRGIYFDTDEGPVTRARVHEEAAKNGENDSLKTSFELIEHVYTHLENLCGNERACRDFPPAVMRLSKLIQKACDANMDATLSTILWASETKYSIKHQVDSAIACEVILRKIGYSPEKRLSALAAALTMNIAMISLQDSLYSHGKRLHERLREAVNAHIVQGVEKLRTLGVQDKEWLEIVFQHHERINGDGYPEGAEGGRICEPARILAIADLYCAKVAGRSYRSSLPANIAIGEVISDKRGHGLDITLARLFATLLGLYPPGAIVRLANGETSIVTHVGSKLDMPLVSSILRSNGIAYSNPMPRNCKDSQFAVKEVVPQALKLAVNRYRLWDF